MKQRYLLDAWLWATVLFVGFYGYWIIERTIDAVWQYWKFKDFGGGGGVTLGRTTQLIALVTSMTFLLLGRWLRSVYKSSMGECSRTRIAEIVSIAGAILTVGWVLILCSPLVTFR